MTSHDRKVVITLFALGLLASALVLGYAREERLLLSWSYVWRPAKPTNTANGAQNDSYPGVLYEMVAPDGTEAMITAADRGLISSSPYRLTGRVRMFAPDGTRVLVTPGSFQFFMAMRKGYQVTPETQFEKEREPGPGLWKIVGKPVLRALFFLALAIFVLYLWTLFIKKNGLKAFLKWLPKQLLFWGLVIGFSFLPGFGFFWSWLCVTSGYLLFDLLRWLAVRAQRGVGRAIRSGAMKPFLKRCGWVILFLGLLLIFNMLDMTFFESLLALAVLGYLFRIDKKFRKAAPAVTASASSPPSPTPRSV